MENQKQTRNMTLDVFKLIAAFMVVFIHVSFDGNVGVIISAIARFAVPLFFFTSGFFSYNNDAKKIKKKIKKILILYLVAFVVYFLYQIAYCLQEGGVSMLTTYLKGVFSLKSILYFLVFNEAKIGGHLWFLLSLLYVYLIWLLVVKFNLKQKVILVLAVITLLIHVVLGELLGAFGIVIPNVYIRNFALMGFPFFALGHVVNANKEKFANVKTVYAIIGLIFGVAETLVSRYLLGNRELFIGSLGILFFIVVISLKYPNKRYPKLLEQLTTTTTDIYVFHVVISLLGLGALARLGINVKNVVFRNVWPIVVIIIAIAFSQILTAIKKAIKLKKKPKEN